MQKEDNLILRISVFIIPICGGLLFLWWRKQITLTYLQKLHKREVEELETEIEKLKKDNEELSKIIHKDNKLIPAMEMAVRNFLSNTTEENRDEVGKRLLNELNTLTQERRGIVTAYETDNKNLPSCGRTRIDSMISFLFQKAASFEINFNFTKNTGVSYLVENIISEQDLCTLIADLADNAIIATKNQPIKNILLTISMENEHYCLHIFDSGIPFEATTIASLGKVRCTTHKNDGGSGIGMMQTFELLRRYKASFILDETISNGLYTKKISIIFDNCHEVQIQSLRPEILSLATNRTDFIFNKH